jgi:hypothetical protein
MERRGRRKIVMRIPVVPRELVKHMKEFKSVKDVSWYLFEDVLEKSGSETMDLVELIYEEALDYRVGSAVLELIRAALKKKGLPKPFTILIRSDGSFEIKW